MSPEEWHLANDDSPLDYAAALRRTEGDAGLLSDLARIFLDDCPRLIAKIRTAVSNAAPRQIEHAAHELKGCLGNFSAAPAFEAAEKLEMLARDGQIADAVTAAGQLEAELGRLHPALERLITRPI